MIFEHDGIIIENKNAFCDSVFIRNGWKPILEKESVQEQPAEEKQETHAEEKHSYTYSELNKYKKDDLKALANELGIQIESVNRPDIIKEIISKQ